MLDDRLPHQIRLLTDSHKIYLSCNCLRKPSGDHEIIREIVPGVNDPRVWYKRWHKERGVEIQVKQSELVGNRPNIICLCGSTRFRDEFNRANHTLTLGGAIVLAPGVWVRADPEFTDLPEALREAQKEALDELHKRKIDLADEVFVINVGGYIGESTRSEIEYAASLDKPIRYLERIK